MSLSAITMFRSSRTRHTVLSRLEAAKEFEARIDIDPQAILEAEVEWRHSEALRLWPEKQEEEELDADDYGPNYDPAHDDGDGEFYSPEEMLMLWRNNQRLGIVRHFIETLAHVPENTVAIAYMAVALGIKWTQFESIAELNNQKFAAPYGCQGSVKDAFFMVRAYLRGDVDRAVNRALDYSEMSESYIDTAIGLGQELLYEALDPRWRRKLVKEYERRAAVARQERIIELAREQAAAHEKWLEENSWRVPLGHYQPTLLEGAKRSRLTA